jgi:hypothetical protein
MNLSLRHKTPDEDPTSRPVHRWMVVIEMGRTTGQMSMPSLTMLGSEGGKIATKSLIPKGLVQMHGSD